ncbi:glutamate receptor 2.7-like isoform X1 [Cucumis melo var. makuwa]|uniref:Glutamate receptor n=4 Tax=Cucumis melo TaxID=3656 RepID=A0A5A7UZU6_CUCMM|nr:glutamate receptor 2.7-like isoform X1 [Cucumis melo var. makuwa]
MVMGSRDGGCCSITVWLLWAVVCASASGELVKVGVVLDPNTTVGILSNTSIQMAFSDFYAENLKYKTRISFIFKDAGDVVEVASAATELLRDGVQAIIGPQTTEQAMYLTEFGRKYEIPIISFTATSPSLSPKQNPYFIRVAQNDLAQVEAINGIIQMYGWREIVPIYEDTEYGRGIIPYLADALQQNGTRLVVRTIIPPSATSAKISKKLSRLKDMRKTIFVLHMTVSVGLKVLSVAKKEGMMSEGYAWIVTDGLSSLVDPMLNSKVMDSMQGIVGVRPYIPITQEFQHFQTKLKQRLSLSLSLALPNIFAVQAYNTLWALAMAVEKVNRPTIPGSATKSELRDAIVKTKFEGISGDFFLVDGELKRPTFEVFNVVAEKEKIIGNWIEGVLFSIKSISKPIWPGHTTDPPWINLTIGIPVKGFPEFVNANIIHPQKSTGFCIDVFKSVVEVLDIPIRYTFVPFVDKNGKSNGSYDDLLRQIDVQKFNVIVGDITIVANRSELVDFTLPYSESRVTMLVSLRNDKKDQHMWIFLKPFKWNLWLVSFISFIFTGFVVWLLECRVNTDFGAGTPQQQIGLIFWFSFSTLVFAHRERILNNLSRFLLIIWVFAVLILTQSYTANLSSMLTAQRLRPSFLDVNEIREKGYYVGYQNDSFVRSFLITQLLLNETKLKPYGNPDEFKEALIRGNNDGGVAAIFDEIPYVKVFLRRNPSGFRMVGPTYATGGLGFAFPKGSPLATYFSRAILNVTEDKDKMKKIENRYFLNEDDPPIPDSNDSPLDVRGFGGLFIITIVANSLSLLIYLIQFFLTHELDSTGYVESTFTSKLVEKVKLFYRMHFHSSSLQTAQSRVHSVPATPPLITDDHVNLTPNLVAAQSSSSLQQPTHSRVSSISETAEATTPDHVNPTENPHNLGVENEH